MAASVPISGLTPLATALASNDLFVFVDVSDTTQSAQGSTKRVTVADAYTAITVNTSLTVTGTASVSGNMTVGGTLGVTGIITAASQISSIAQHALVQTFAGTAHATDEIANTGGDLIWGVESSAGGAVFGGTSAYSVVFGTAIAGKSLHLVTNNLTQFTIDSAGLVTIPGTINGQTISAAASFTGTVNIAGTLSGVAGTFSAGLTSTSPTAGVGYATGAGGTATQTGNRSAAVTINKICGSITTDITSLASGNSVIFTVNNTTVGASDTIVLSAAGGWAQATSHQYFVVGVAANSFQIFYLNNSGIAETGAGVFNFAVIKGVTS